MPDLFLYSGQASPADVKLTDPTVLAGGGTNANVDAITATAIAAAIAAAVTADGAATSPIALATASAIVPVVSADENIAAVTAAATAAAPIPSLTAAANVAAVVATATSAGLVPSVSGDASAVAVTAAATAAGLVPAVSADLSVVAPVATAQAAGVAPAVGADGSASAPVATALAAIAAPAVAADAAVSGVVATALATAPVPVVAGTSGGDASVDVPLATVTAAALAPDVVGTEAVGDGDGVRFFVDRRKRKPLPPPQYPAVVIAPTITLVAVAFAPTITAGSNVLAPVVSIRAQALAPEGGASASVDAAAAGSSSAASAPEVFGSAVVTAPIGVGRFHRFTVEGTLRGRSLEVQLEDGPLVVKARPKTVKLADRALVNQYVPMLKVKIEPWLREQAPRVAEEVKRYYRKIRKAEMPPIGDWSGIIAIIEPYLEEIYRKSGEASQLGLKRGPFDQVNERAVAWARKRAAEMVGMKYNAAGDLVPNPNARWVITDTTRDSIRDLVRQALDEGMSPDDLGVAIEALGDFSDWRAELIADTELSNAQTSGALEGWRASGVVSGKSWLLSNDHDGDDECNDNADAGVIDLEDVFPSGDDGPPAHPRCMCDVAAEVMEVADEEAA